MFDTLQSLVLLIFVCQNLLTVRVIRHRVIVIEDDKGVNMPNVRAQFVERSPDLFSKSLQN